MKVDYDDLVLFCLQCGIKLKSRKGKKYCSDKCRYLGLSALLLLAGVTAEAYPAPTYRWRFQPNTSNPCWASGTHYYTGGQSPVNQSDPPLTIANGDSLIISTLPDGGCCSSNPQTVGDTWEEVDYHDGKGFQMIYPTFLPLNMSPITSEEKWTFNTTVNPLGVQAQNLVQCNPGGN